MVRFLKGVAVLFMIVYQVCLSTCFFVVNCTDTQSVAHAASTTDKHKLLYTQIAAAKVGANVTHMTKIAPSFGLTLMVVR